jgi:hypothetical protein
VFGNVRIFLTEVVCWECTDIPHRDSVLGNVRIFLTEVVCWEMYGYSSQRYCNGSIYGRSVQGCCDLRIYPHSS